MLKLLTNCIVYGPCVCPPTFLVGFLDQFSVVKMCVVCHACAWQSVPIIIIVN